MSKEIQLYSKDNKYKCAIELADSKDIFGCPDHSRIMLFEERDDKIYLIADAKDRLLKTEKDQRIAELEKQLAELKEKAIVPKFKIGQEVWYVYNKYQRFPFRCVIDKIVYDSSKNYKFRYDTSSELYIGVKEEDLFATEQEAQTKLNEIQNEQS